MTPRAWLAQRAFEVVAAGRKQRPPIVTEGVLVDPVANVRLGSEESHVASLLKFANRHAGSCHVENLEVCYDRLPIVGVERDVLPSITA